MRKLSACLTLAAALVSCQPKSEPPPPADSSATPAPPTTGQGGIADREWLLTRVGDIASPLGNGGKPVTMTLQSADQRAFGNAGCNRYSGPYTLTGTALSFGPAISTKMACEQGMDVETAFLSMLPHVTTFSATDSSLTLSGADGPLATFR